MYATVSADAVAAIRIDARRAAARGSLAKRLWQRLDTARRSRADREIAAMLRDLGHAGLVADFQQARGGR